jgi:hypothetical protein
MGANPFGLPPSDEDPYLPRASLLATPGELCRAGIWMGGAHSLRGDAVLIEHAERGWFVDCAGDMPPTYREAAARWTPHVFADIDAVPPAIERLLEIVRRIAAELREGVVEADHLFLMCQHGMNRSGLVAGLMLRELGLGGEAAVERILSQRPGALSNVAFRTIVLEGEGRRERGEGDATRRPL